MQINLLKNNRWWRRLALLIAGLGVVGGLAWVALPGIVKGQLERLVSDRLGRQLSVGAVSLNPWTLELTLEDLVLAQSGGGSPQLRIKRIYLDAELQSLRHLAPVVDALVIEGVSATLTHFGDGRYDVDDILARLAVSASPDAAPRSLPRFALHNLRLQGLSLDFVDQPAQQTHRLRELNFSLPFLSNLEALREINTEPRLAFELNGAHFDSAAQSAPFAVSHKTQAHFRLAALDVRPFLAYLPKSLPLQVQAGLLDLDLQLAFEQVGKPVVKLSGTVAIKGGRIADGRAQELLAFDALRLELTALRPLEQVLEFAAVEWTRPSLHLRRDKAGAINVLHLGGVAAAAPKEAAAPQAPTPAWRVHVARIGVLAGQVLWTDEAADTPVRLEMGDLTLETSGLAWPPASPVPLNGAFTLRSPARPKAAAGAPGEVKFSGLVGLRPMTVQGQLQATRLPLQTLAPYLVEVLNVELLRAQAGFIGELRYADRAGRGAFEVRGDAVLENFHANSLPTTRAVAGELPLGQELLSWKALNLRGLALAVAPGQATSVAVKEAALTDFYARVIVNESGRINLQNVVKRPPADAAQPGPAPATEPATASAPKPLIRIGQISLVNGRMLFSDRFIQPNYTARLTELTGRLGAFSSASASGSPGAAPASPPMAELALRGRAEGSAALEITGKLNPLAEPLALDIQGKMRNLELMPLSPYSVKYAGHGIERGQLSMDVAYRVLPDGQLTASNKLVLNQLTFGEPVEGAPSTLPVRLAVALLADRNGVIDVDLPISGSLNDPEFSLGHVIFKVIGNLLAKAVTAPFSLLAAIFSGGDESSTVDFAPGSAALSAPANEKLDKVVQALKERPALRLTVIGSASLDAEREAFRRERLQALLQAEKQRAAAVAGKAAQEVAPVSAAEVPALLQEVYKRAAMPKPRNLLGLLKDLPPAEMEALLLAHIEVNEDLMRELAVARGVAVQNYLSAREVPPAQLLLGAPNLLAAGADFPARAALQLAVK